MKLQGMLLENGNFHCFAKLSLAKCPAHSNKYLFTKGMNLRELSNLPNNHSGLGNPAMGTINFWIYCIYYMGSAENMGLK